ncbi:somatostatin receptor type 2-like [Patiria miniata]|uniref:G-protein coupled receptors family 1 profile domain-containing protein n=1 Tax=Patiria miniata TaxID=46514 RepID=A0A913ZJV6_PATMI|nr:somatostatin receptor type 2-like [Patiria miniata]
MENTSASVDFLTSTASSNTSVVDQQTPNAVHTFSVVINLILGIIGLMGNTIVVLTVRKTRSFHDITHYLIVSLAMSDFLCCLFFICSILFVVEGRPIQVDIPQGFFGEIFCRLFWSLHLFWSAFFASAFNLVVVTFERYFAIVHPIAYARSFTKKRGLMLAVSAWALGFLLETEFLIRFYVNDSGECIFPGLGPVWFAKLMFLKSFVISFVAPLIFLVWAYYKILKTIRQAAANSECQEGMMGQQRAALREASRRVVQCLLIITTLFILLLLPSELGNVFLFFELPVDARLGFWEVFRTLTVMNSVVNPVVYAIRLKKFRRAMKATLCSCVKTQIQQEDSTDTNGIGLNTIYSTTAP